jgi:hypothetical protein
MELCTSHRRGGGTEIRGLKRELDQDRIPIANQHARRPIAHAALASDQRKRAAKQRVGGIRDLNPLRFDERS